MNICGVIIWTDQFSTMNFFYRDILGLSLHSESEDFVAFNMGSGLRLSLGVHSKVRGKSNDSHRIMVNLGVENIDLTYKRLVASGVSFLRTPERERWGGYVATLKDPDNNIIQLLQQPRK
jgi:predicted enzyme related to lactoylglutathione lyase